MSLWLGHRRVLSLCFVVYAHTTYSGTYNGDNAQIMHYNTHNAQINYVYLDYNV